MQTQEEKRAYGRKRYAENFEKLRAQCMDYYRTHRMEIILKKREVRRIRKLKGLPSNRGRWNTKPKKGIVMEHYGGHCFCCGERTPKLLTIDHKNNDGRKTQRKSGARLTGESLYCFIVKNNFPADLQIACFNCNIGRQNNRGVCPHRG